MKADAWNSTTNSATKNATNARPYKVANKPSPTKAGAWQAHAAKKEQTQAKMTKVNEAKVGLMQEDGMGGDMTEPGETEMYALKRHRRE